MVTIDIPPLKLLKHHNNGRIIFRYVMVIRQLLLANFREG